MIASIVTENGSLTVNYMVAGLSREQVKSLYDACLVFAEHPEVLATQISVTKEPGVRTWLYTFTDGTRTWTQQIRFELPNSEVADIITTTDEWPETVFGLHRITRPVLQDLLIPFDVTSILFTR